MSDKQAIRFTESVASEAKEYMDALETKNAELQKQVDREYAMRKELGKQYLRAVELLESAQVCAAANGHRALWSD
jgi:hypothetical protein